MNENELYKKVGEAISVRRNELGHTQEYVARAVGLSRASLANIERGRQKILLHYLFRIAEILELRGVESLLPTLARLQSSPHEELTIGGDELNEKQRAEVLAFVGQSPPNRRTSRGKK